MSHATHRRHGQLRLATGAIAFGQLKPLLGTGRFSNASGELPRRDASAVTLTGFYVALGTLSH
jgi:hypothetical protein